MNKPSISVVIPVYNKEKYIDKCIDSVINQTIKKEDIEIICVNDGSTDGSIDIINKYIAKNNIVLINKENGGVSSARNCGIMNASGKYILFLDADDSISNNTTLDIVKYFDSVYNDVDIVTYNIYYNNGKIRKGKRGQNIKENCIIDVSKNVDFSQTTMNICIKNDKSILFDDSFFIAEDQLFNTSIIKNKAKIGWCNSAKYIYNRYGSDTGLLNHPYYSYDSVILYFNKLLDIGKNNPQMDDYCKSLILYNLDWRIKGDYFYPYHKNGGIEAIDDDMQKIIDSIDNRLILKNRWLLYDHKNFLMSLKKKNNPFPIYEDTCISICDNDGELQKEKSFTLCVQRERICGNVYKIMGFLKNTAICFGVKPRLFIDCSGKIQEIELYESVNSRFCTKIKTNPYYGMETEILLHEGVEISFFVLIQDNRYDVSLWFRPYSSISSESKINFHFSQIYSIERKGQKLFCYKSDTLYIINKYKEFISEIKKNHYGKYIIHNIAEFIKKRKRIWLYSDARDYYDNAYIQFNHDSKIKDGILKFYIYKGSKSLMRKKFSFMERLFVIREKSFMHRLLFIASEKIFTSFFEKSMYVPYEKSYIYYQDIINFEGVYLQHGVMHAKLDHMYGKDNSFFIDKIAVSTFFEKETALNRLNFKKNDVIESGAPRYSILKRSSTKNRIIYAPSWRQYMLNHTGSDKWIKKSSNFKLINEINTFLSNEEFISFLERNDLYLDVKLHRNFKSYDNDILFSSERISIVENTDISEYKLCISDISSFIFDFVFLKIPVIKFIPDMDMITAGLHSYREFNFDLNEIGECVYSVGELIKAIDKNCMNGFKENYDVSKIFIPNVSNATENFYHALNGEN